MFGLLKIFQKRRVGKTKNPGLVEWEGERTHDSLRKRNIESGRKYSPPLAERKELEK